MTATPTDSAPVGRPTSPTPSPTPDAPGRGGAHRLVGMVLGVPTVIALMLLAFAMPAVSSGAHDLPIAVSGPAPAVARVTDALETSSPGTFDVTTHTSAEQAADAIRDREAVGGIAVAPQGVTIQTAAGAGAPYAAVLRGLGAQLAASGQQVSYAELAPLPKDDPAGAGMTALGLPLVFGGIASAAALLLAHGGSVRSRLTAATAIAVLAGFTVTAILQFGFGSFDGSYWATAAAASAGIAAISLTVLGLGMLLGRHGLGLGAVLMLFVANPLAGLGTGPAWLPQPWGEVGQYLPLGSAGTAIRSHAYFDGNGATTAWLVLGCWVLAGLALAGLAARRASTSNLNPLDDRIVAGA